MAKYVCDIEQVHAIGEKLCTSVATIGTSISSYSTNIETDLSGWTGEGAQSGKEAFITAKNEQVASANKDVEYANELGEFIQEAAENIQKVEDELVSLSI